MNISPIAKFYSPFGSKFGVPRQSGVVAGLRGKIVFEPEYRNQDAIRGLEEFDYLWIIWEFSLCGEDWHPTVRPPRLGGNQRVGVFASRSPFRPNRLGLSSVKIERIEMDSQDGPVIHVLGADLADGTPIVDIKPYISYCDSHPEARSGFVDANSWQKLKVVFPEILRADFINNGHSEESADTLVDILSQDPRPHYHGDKEKDYGLLFEGTDVHFIVSNSELTITSLLLPDSPCGTDTHRREPDV